MMFEIREMIIDDYDQSIRLWRQTDGMGLSDADSRESIHEYLNRNVGMSFVCVKNDQVIGTILCGHDGRRGYIYHLAVAANYRGNSLGKKLVETSLEKLKLAGIGKCHIMVIHDNEIGNQFWSKSGWKKRDDIFIYSSSTSIKNE